MNHDLEYKKAGRHSPEMLESFKKFFIFFKPDPIINLENSKC